MTDQERKQSQAWSMLTTRAQQYERAPGGHEGLTPAEVAGMLAGLEQRAFCAGMLCEAGEWSYLSRVGRSLYLYALELATQERWNLPRGPGQIADLVHLALLEATGPTVPCMVCGGSGCTAPEGNPARRSCDVCEGSGRVPRTQRSRAELIGISEAQWFAVWKNRYRGVYSELNNWTSDARTFLARQLRARRERQR